jgi:PAS domain S-box-containing protein
MALIDLHRIQGISLKWKLLIPFLFFAFAGTTTLTFIGLTSQQRLIKEEERKALLHHYQHFLEKIDEKKTLALALATMIAENPHVQKLFAERERQALNDFLIYTFVGLKIDFNISQLHFHTPPATSFLRLHQPRLFGDEMSSYRETIREALKNYRKAGGLERGKTGFGIRGVVPVFYNDKVVGTVEVGHSFGDAFLEEVHRGWGIDLALYEIKNGNTYDLMGKAGRSGEKRLASQHMNGRKIDEPIILISPAAYRDRSILFGVVKDFTGKPVALAEITVDRSEILARLSNSFRLMVVVGFTGIAVSFLLTYAVAILFIRPIKEIVTEAQEIALEKRDTQLDQRPADEIGTLTQALNTMLDALKDRRKKIEDYARTLEIRVLARTADLVASEEKYRTLVENVPLIVYRILRDGTTEFVNSYLTESLGYSIEDAVGNRRFWKEKIWESEAEDREEIFDACFDDEEECRKERLVRHRSGRVLTFIDHAIPMKDENGRIKWIDGIMMDITELKRLQERALMAEEIKTLGELSARMAHEIRNPLVTAGGFARRLMDSLPADDPNRRVAKIIVEEMARLENFLRMLLSTIKPFDLCISDVHVNDLLQSWVLKLEDALKLREIHLHKAFLPDIPVIQGDRERLSQAFESLLKHAMVSMPRGETLVLATGHMDDHISVTLKHRAYRITVDDLEKFFFPHIGWETDPSLLDLPLSKIIIHRHGGKVDIDQDQGDMLVIRIELPVRYRMESSG